MNESSTVAAAAGGSSNSSIMAAPNVADSSKAVTYEFHPSISEEERRFYLKAYPTVDIVRDRKVHCTVCKTHIGTAPVQETGIKMHPILRVTHCMKCHDFYNSGEFSKGEDGSELYCRWCGQGGEVYCCSSCPYVFCKSCIVKNLSRGVVADIEQNENWNCFSCAPKILWPLRAQHWALMNYIEQQKKEVYALNLGEAETKQQLQKDRSKCCRLAKSKCGNMSDSMESLDSVASKRSHGSAGSAKKAIKHSATPSPQNPNAKRIKTNDEVVCTPDLLSMLEPDCQITLSQKPNQRPMQSPSATTPRIMSIQQPGYGLNSTSTPKTSAPPPLVLRNTAIKLRPAVQPPIVRRTVIGPRAPAPGGNGTPVYHTINGYRIDLNSAAQQETFRLPNGKLIQVKRQGPPPGSNSMHISSSSNNWQQMQGQQPQQQQQAQRVVPQTIASRPVQITQHPYPGPNGPQQQSQHPQVVRYHNSMIGSTTINAIGHNGTPLQTMNGQVHSAPAQNVQQNHPSQQQQQLTPGAPIRPVMVRHIFPDTPIGQARTQLQEQVFNAMEICTHLTNKVQTLTNSNAYKQAKNYLEVKELYIHLSYLLTYAVGRFKGLQDKCLADMRHLGFGNDADCLENGQLAADKQASDDEDNEIEIVEPKTDLITLDSDDDEPPPSKMQKPVVSTPTTPSTPSTPSTPTAMHTKVTVPTLNNQNSSTTPGTPARPNSAEDENIDLMTMAQSFLASMLEVDIQEGPQNSSPSSSDSTQVKKQPRKKLTNKPNPTLLKQKAIMERERLEEMKRNDQKLKMKCAVQLKKAEDEYPFAKEMLEAKLREKQQLEAQLAKEKETLKEISTTMMVDTGKETIEVQLVIEDDTANSSTEENATKAIISQESEADEGSPQKKIILIEQQTEGENLPVALEKEQSEVDQAKKQCTDKTEEIKELLENKESAATEDPKESSDKNNESNAIENTKGNNENLAANEIEKTSKEVDKNQSKEKTPEEGEEKSPPIIIPTNGKLETAEVKEQAKAKKVVSSSSPSATVQEETMDEDVPTSNGSQTEADTVDESTKEDKTKVDESKTEIVDPTAEVISTKDDVGSTNDDANKSTEDLEDADVYKEIEKVLQRRHDNESDEDDEEDEQETETELVKEKASSNSDCVPTAATKSVVSKDVNDTMVESSREKLLSTPSAILDKPESNSLKVSTTMTATDLVSNRNRNEVEGKVNSDIKTNEQTIAPVSAAPEEITSNGLV